MFLMPETPPIGTPVHAVVLEAHSAAFPATGEVVILKRIRNGRIRVRSRRLYKHQPVREEFDEIELPKIRNRLNTDKAKQPRRLSDSIGQHRTKARRSDPPDLPAQTDFLFGK